MKLTQEQIKKIEWRLDLQHGSTLPEMAASLANAEGEPKKIRKQHHDEAVKLYEKMRRVDGRRANDVDNISDLKRAHDRKVEEGNNLFRAELRRLQKEVFEPGVLEYIKSEYGAAERLDHDTISYGARLLYSISRKHFRKTQISDSMALEVKNLPVPSTASK